MERVDLLAFIRRLCLQLGVSPAEVLPLMEAENPQLVAVYNQVFHESAQLALVYEGDQDLLLAQLKDENGFLSFQNLCRYIEDTPFDTSEFNGKGKKLYQVYQELPKAQRQAFMEKYLRHNHKKQILVEEASQSVYKSFSESSLARKFQKDHAKTLRQWHIQIAEALAKESEVGQTQLVSVFLANTLASICLSHLLESTLSKKEASFSNTVQRIAYSLRVQFRRRKLPQQLFSTDQSVALAGALIKIATTVCRWEDNGTSEPVFSHKYVKLGSGRKSFKSAGILQICPKVLDQFLAYKDLYLSGLYRFPMLHPPKPWTTPQSGGFLTYQVQLVKSPEPDVTDKYMEKAHSTGQLNSIYDSLTSLGSTAWTINPFTSSVFNEAFTKNLKAVLPKGLRPTQIELSPKPKFEDYEDPSAYEAAQREWYHTEKKQQQVETDVRNLSVFYHFTNQLQKSLAKNGEVFYLPHTLDFRGRTYPESSFLSHHNEDLIRSLMMFWEAKPLGNSGFDWLKYQLANLYSKQKLTMRELKDFINQNAEDIKSSAKYPFECLWWTHGDNPWQSLALCNEISSIWNHGNPATYESSIPVHQDGLCNGLQHYAALGADEHAARSVNVLPTEARQDIYTDVLELVEIKISDDLNSSNADVRANAALAKPVLSRSLIKQSIMTSVYGVTLYGAMWQILGRLDDLPTSIHDIPGNSTVRLGGYIARKVLASISEFFLGAQKIQEWLVENCDRCVLSHDPESPPTDVLSGTSYKPMMWTSLSGFPVVQLYRKRAAHVIDAGMQHVSFLDLLKVAPIDPLKLRNGIAPNFIHSIDSIHLMMTVIETRNANLSFAAVHDSFWTHASDVDMLSRILREEFVRLHSSSIIEHLCRDLRHIMRNCLQLVWVEREKHFEFTSRLEELRSTGLGKTLNEQLLMELANNTAVQKIVAEFKPELLFGKKPKIYNENPAEATRDLKLHLRKCIPLLVPVQILNPPSVGSLDVKQVLHSRYFFS